MRVEMDRLHLPGQNRDAILGYMPTHFGFKADVVSGFEVGDVDIARLGVDSHIKQDRTGTGERPDFNGRCLGCINFKNVLVGQVKANACGPVSEGGIDPLLAHEFDNHRLPGRGNTGRCRRGRRNAEPREAVIDDVVVPHGGADGKGIKDGGLIARVKGGCVDACALGIDRKRARGVTEKSQNMWVHIQVFTIEDPNVCLADARCRKLWISGMILASVRRGNKELFSFRSGEDDIARLIANQEGCFDERLCGVACIHYGHTIGEVIDDVEFAFARDCKGYWVQSYHRFANRL